MATDRGIKKTIALIGHAAQVTRDEQDWHSQLFAHREQTVARNIDAGIFHVDGRLLAAEGRTGSNGDRFLFTGGWRSVPSPDHLGSAE